MKLRKNIVIHLITVGVILASCSTTKNNSLAYNLPKTTKITISSEQYYKYQKFDVSVINELNELYSFQSLAREEKINIRKLRNNFKKLSSKKSFLLNLDATNIHSLKVMELIYRLELPIKIYWDDKGQGMKFVDLITKPVTGFCSSLNQDAIDSIASEIAGSGQQTMIIYMKNYALALERLAKFIPAMKTIQFDSDDPQKFAAMLLGIESSQNRFIKIKNLNPNQKLKFLPRSRNDLQKIVLILEPNQYKSLLPALRYHGGNKFQYINFISALDNLNDVNQLLDFESTLIPMSVNIAEEIKTKKMLSLENITRDSILSDWLLIELMNQSGVGSADISGMTGKLEFQKGGCTKRKIPLKNVDSQWVTS